MLLFTIGENATVVCLIVCPILCLPCSVAAGLHCAQWSYQADDTLHDGGCRAAVIGMDKVKCGTPSFEESTVPFFSCPNYDAYTI